MAETNLPKLESIRTRIQHLAEISEFITRELDDLSRLLGRPGNDSLIGIDTCRQRDFNGTVPGRRP